MADGGGLRVLRPSGTMGLHDALCAHTVSLSSAPRADDNRRHWGRVTGYVVGWLVVEAYAVGCSVPKAEWQSEAENAELAALAPQIPNEMPKRDDDQALVPNREPSVKGTGSTAAAEKLELQLFRVHRMTTEFGDQVALDIRVTRQNGQPDAQANLNSRNFTFTDQLGAAYHADWQMRGPSECSHDTALPTNGYVDCTVFVAASRGFKSGTVALQLPYSGTTAVISVSGTASKSSSRKHR